MKRNHFVCQKLKKKIHSEPMTYKNRKILEGKKWWFKKTEHNIKASHATYKTSINFDLFVNWNVVDDDDVLVALVFIGFLVVGCCWKKTCSAFFFQKFHFFSWLNLMGMSVRWMNEWSLLLWPTKKIIMICLDFFFQLKILVRWWKTIWSISCWNFSLKKNLFVFTAHPGCIIPDFFSLFWIIIYNVFFLSFSCKTHPQFNPKKND